MPGGRNFVGRVEGVIARAAVHLVRASLGDEQVGAFEALQNVVVVVAAAEEIVARGAPEIVGAAEGDAGFEGLVSVELHRAGVFYYPELGSQRIYPRLRTLH